MGPWIIRKPTCLDLFWTLKQRHPYSLFYSFVYAFTFMSYIHLLYMYAYIYLCIHMQLFSCSACTNTNMHIYYIHSPSHFIDGCGSIPGTSGALSLTVVFHILVGDHPPYWLFILTHIHMIVSSMLRIRASIFPFSPNVPMKFPKNPNVFGIL